MDGPSPLEPALSDALEESFVKRIVILSDACHTNTYFKEL